MRLLVLAALCLLPLAAQAQTAPPDPLRTNPLTGEPRAFFEPIGSEEVTERMGACIRRDLGSGGKAEAVALACEAETLDFCGRVAALYPLSKAGACALSVQLAWGELRNDAGLEVVDAIYERVFAGEESARAEAEAFTAEDGVWRTQAGNACIGEMEEGERVACKTAFQRERAILYYARLADGDGQRAP